MGISKKILAGFVLALTMHNSFAANEWRILSAILRIFSGVADIAATVEETDTRPSFNQTAFDQTVFDRDQIAFHKNRFEHMINLIGYHNQWSISQSSADEFKRCVRDDARAHVESSRRAFHCVRTRVDDAISELNRIRNRHWHEGYPFGYSLDTFINGMNRLSDFIRRSRAYDEEPWW